MTRQRFYKSTGRYLLASLLALATVCSMAQTPAGPAPDEMKQIDEAIATYRRNTEQTPADPEAWNGLCWKLILAERAREARAACERSVAIKQTYVNTANLGHTYLLTGDTEDAYRWYRETLGLLESEKNLKEGPLDNFDQFIKKEWQAVESQKARQWMEDAYGQVEKANSLRQQSVKLSKAGDYAKALPLALQDLSIREKISRPRPFQYWHQSERPGGAVQIHGAIRTGRAAVSARIGYFRKGQWPPTPVHWRPPE